MPAEGDYGCDGYGNHDCGVGPPAVALEPEDCQLPSCEWDPPAFASRNVSDLDQLGRYRT